MDVAPFLILSWLIAKHFMEGLVTGFELLIESVILHATKHKSGHFNGWCQLTDLGVYFVRFCMPPSSKTEDKVHWQEK